MSAVAAKTPIQHQLPKALRRRFEAIMFDWDGTAVPDRGSDASPIRGLVEKACAAGLELAIVSGTHLENIDRQLVARPTGPGTLTMLMNRGSEAFRVDRDGPRLLTRRIAGPAEDKALSDAAAQTVKRLAQRGLTAQIVAQRLNRRKIDLIPEPAWADPPKARIAELLNAVQQRLAAAGIEGLEAAVAIARDAALQAGVADPRVTSDAKHIEIGLTDKSDSGNWYMDELWRVGIAPGQVLIAGDELGSLGGVPGSDSLLLTGRGEQATAISVGAEPAGVPTGVVALGGGPPMFAAVLADQIARRREVPTIEGDPTWTLDIDGAEPLLERVREALLTLADGRLGTRGSVLVTNAADTPSVLHAGVYSGSGPQTELWAGPLWNHVPVELAGTAKVRRVLDLHTGLMRQELTSGDARLDALLLSSLARPATTVARIRDRGFGIASGRGLQPPTDVAPEGGTTAGGEWMRAVGSPGSIAAASCDTASGPAHDRVLDRITAYEGDATGIADERRALSRLASAADAGFDTLLSEHRRAWGERWENADVRVDGDPELQLAVRLALFHMMASVGSEGEAAVGARGLTGGGYRGHVFWDSDVYVLPFLAATHPPAARAMLEYRVRRLPASMHAARGMGRSGARFAWESATSGEDVTPRSARGRDGEMAPILTGELEEHIVADVAWAAQHYTDWTGDSAFAQGPGRELLVQTARWWASRIELDDEDRAHIRAVIGPDEYHERVDDNAYTNVMARWNLRQAANATADGAVDPSERHHWLDLADALVDGYDPQTQLYEEFAGFYALEPLIISEIAPRRPVAAVELLGAARTRAAQVVKQADVLMLHYLIPDEVAAGSLGPNLAFYEPRTAHGSSLSTGVHAALLARAGRGDTALELLRQTARIDLDDIGQVTAAGLHLAAMGSLWRALSFGFAGLRPTENGLLIDPVEIPGIDALDLRVHFRGSRVRVRVTAGAAELSASPPTMILAPGLDPHEVGSTPFRFELSPLSQRCSE